MSWCRPDEWTRAASAQDVARAVRTVWAIGLLRGEPNRQELEYFADRVDFLDLLSGVTVETK